MSTDFLHGVETLTIERGPRPVQTIRSAVIGCIGTATGTGAEAAFPFDTPVLVKSRRDYAAITGGTLKQALDGIFDQFSPFVIVINVEEGENETETIANVLGGVDADTGVMTGIHAFRAAEAELGLTPMLLVAPGFTGERPTGVETVPVSTQGTGYTSAPTVSFTGGGGSGATAHAVLGSGASAGKVTSIVVDNPGRGYTSAPTASLTGGGSSQAATLGTVTIQAQPNPVTAALLTLAEQFRAHVVVSGPNTTDGAAIAYRGDWGSRRIYIVDPTPKVYDAEAGAYVLDVDPTARTVGLVAKNDHERGFWTSPSNQVVNGIGNLARPVDWALGDPNTRANLLNENEVATFIRDDGWRLWGNRTASDDPKWAFLSVSRTADMIDLSIKKAHRWAVDRNITKNYFEDVTSSVNRYLRSLQARGAILGGRCWVDRTKNSDAEIAAGHATFSYDFTVPSPAERVTFESSVVDDYIASIFA